MATSTSTAGIIIPADPDMEALSAFSGHMPGEIVMAAATSEEAADSPKGLGADLVFGFATGVDAILVPGVATPVVDAMPPDAASLATSVSFAEVTAARSRGVTFMPVSTPTPVDTSTSEVARRSSAVAEEPSVVAEEQSVVVEERSTSTRPALGGSALAESSTSVTPEGSQSSRPPGRRGGPGRGRTWKSGPPKYLQKSNADAAPTKRGRKLNTKPENLDADASRPQRQSTGSSIIMPELTLDEEEDAGVATRSRKRKVTNVADGQDDGLDDESMTDDGSSDDADYGMPRKRRKSPSKASSGKPTCAGCTQTGHAILNCPYTVCNRCHGKGHPAMNCPMGGYRLGHGDNDLEAQTVGVRKQSTQLLITGLDAGADNEVAPRLAKKRGRPPKRPSVARLDAESATEVAPEPAKKRGRPPKKPDVNEGGQPIMTKKKRGRPSLASIAAAAAAAAAAADAANGKTSGAEVSGAVDDNQEPGSVLAEKGNTEGADVVAPRKRGRPKGSTKKEKAASLKTRRPRGRPRKYPRHDDVVNQENGNVTMPEPAGIAPLTQLRDVPGDVIELIMMLVDIRSLVHFQMTCRQQRALIVGNQGLWKRRVIDDFGFPTVAFEPSTSLSCPGWFNVYVAHHNVCEVSCRLLSQLVFGGLTSSIQMFTGSYEIFRPSQSIGAYDPNYNPKDDKRPAPFEYEDDPNAPSTPESDYDENQPDHVIDADEVTALLAEGVTSQVSTLVAPEQWETYAIARDATKLREALEGFTIIRTFPRFVVEGCVTRMAGELRYGSRLNCMGYNDTFELFLGRTGEVLWVAPVEAKGGLKDAVWRSSPGAKLEPLEFRGDVLALARGDGIRTFGPVPPTLAVVWGFEKEMREHDMDITRDAVEVAEMPEASSGVSVGVWHVRVEGDLMVLLATVSYSFEVNGSVASDVMEAADGSYSWGEIHRAGEDPVVRKKRRANVILLYRIHRTGGTVRLVKGFDVTVELHKYTFDWDPTRSKLWDDEGFEPEALTEKTLSGHYHSYDRHMFGFAGSYIYDFAIHGRIALLCCQGYRLDVPYDNGVNQGHLVCLDLCSGVVSWSAAFAQPPDRIGPIPRDGSAVLLRKSGAIFGVAFRNIEDDETWGVEQCWPVERVGINQYFEASEGGDAADGEEEEEASPELASVKSLVFRDMAVWNQERVDGKLKNHMLYLWEPVE
ncbi:hypothetical protein HK101_006176 [Irineochytrium annulatum]|nr:hypothetical protein HK101_006176 [Irineochytrium annulatum]